jgi:hypothetical protein
MYRNEEGKAKPVALSYQNCQFKGIVSRDFLLPLFFMTHLQSRP